MSVAPFEYTLPPERIASNPPRIRGRSRLLVLDRSNQSLNDHRYYDLVSFVQPGNLLIINDTRVIKARLLAKTVDGHERELFLAEKHATPLLSMTARILYRGKLREGDVLTVGKEGIEVLKVYKGGEALIRATAPPQVIAERYGHVPLPPYIKRADTESDIDRYQTVFARKDGSVAAPTASLNLTDSLLEKVRSQGIEVANLTLHVGRGTFMPIRTEDVATHQMHEEYYSIPQKTVRAIRKAKAEGRRVVAVGTTVTRALEHAADELLNPTAKSGGDTLLRSDRIRGEADIFIYPGYRFRIVDTLLTNFHAPDSTVLQLAAAFAGVDLLESAYAHALAGPYKFLSYGDSMLIT